MNEYELKNYLFRKYDIEYNRNLKRLYIHKPIIVSDMQLVRAITKNYDIQEIIVEPRSYLRI